MDNDERAEVIGLLYLLPLRTRLRISNTRAAAHNACGRSRAISAHGRRAYQNEMVVVGVM